GKVLVAGGLGSIGDSVSSAELYDPAIGTWSATDMLTAARDGHAATLLPNGKVLVAGGVNVPTNGIVTTLSSRELYDPATETWTATNSLNTARGGQTATLLPCGQVIVTGGSNGGRRLSSTEVYYYADAMWTNTGAMNTPRTDHTGNLYPDERDVAVV